MLLRRKTPLIYNSSLTIDISLKALIDVFIVRGRYNEQQFKS